MRISLIVAVAENGVIGNDGQLPWHLPADLKHFKNTTMGKPLIMGRKTYESIGKPLPGRTMIVLTRDPDYTVPNVIVAADWRAALERAEDVLNRTGKGEVMVIGGAEIYAMALADATQIYLTEVHTKIEGDTVFPAFDRSLWRETSREDHAAIAPGEPAFSFVTLAR